MICKMPLLQAGSDVEGNGEAGGVFSVDYDANFDYVTRLGNSQQDGLISLSQTDDEYDNAGVGLEAYVSNSGGLSNGSISNKVVLSTRGDVPHMGNHDSVRAAPSPISIGMTLGNSCTPILDAKNKVGLSLIEVSSENLAVRPTMEEVIAFGGIPKPSLTARTSDRLGGRPGEDVPILEKAMMNAQMRDVSSSAGKSLPFKFSIVNIPDSEISNKAGRLGISLGQSEGEVVKSIRGIKMLEEERILTILQKNVDEYVNKEEDPSTLVMSKVSTLCEDLVEDDCIPLDFDDHLEHLNPVVKVKKTRVRKIYDTNNIRKSTRRRIKKQFS
jgi:hypothetical protein